MANLGLSRLRHSTPEGRVDSFKPRMSPAAPLGPRCWDWFLLNFQAIVDNHIRKQLRAGTIPGREIAENPPSEPPERDG